MRAVPALRCIKFGKDAFIFFRGSVSTVYFATLTRTDDRYGGTASAINSCNRIDIAKNSIIADDVNAHHTYLSAADRFSECLGLN